MKLKKWIRAVLPAHKRKNLAAESGNGIFAGIFVP